MYTYAMLEDWDSWQKYRVAFLETNEKNATKATDLVYGWLSIYKEFKQSGKKPTQQTIERLQSTLDDLEQPHITYYVEELISRLDINISSDTTTNEPVTSELDPVIAKFACNPDEYD